ncbi:hypothetical protein DID73_00755 [Candidatus Marinamargulisbacteria bacterium SCGC AG-343-K17]|nr:hypothetical protein DID73_00755 [Candidatus Marinamargulisbacteria bacterium SCGC AG-343-K17]
MTFLNNVRANISTATLILGKFAEAQAPGSLAGCIMNPQDCPPKNCSETNPSTTFISSNDKIAYCEEGFHTGQKTVSCHTEELDRILGMDATTILASIQFSTPNELNTTSLTQVASTLGIISGQTKEGCSETFSFETDNNRGLVESMLSEGTTTRCESSCTEGTTAAATSDHKKASSAYQEKLSVAITSLAVVTGVIPTLTAD